jgi:hypothetical protein
MALRVQRSALHTARRVTPPAFDSDLRAAFQAGSTSEWTIVTFVVPGVGLDGSEVSSMKLLAAEELLSFTCDAYKPTGTRLCAPCDRVCVYPEARLPMHDLSLETLSSLN